jgi:transcriptional regulator with XRE-family HTH domain
VERGSLAVNVISSSQLRAARALVGWTPEQLAEKAHLPFVSLLDYESGGRAMSVDAAATLKHTLEKAGVAFSDDETGVSLLPTPDIVPLEKLNSSNDE